ncbi:4'-phosphopantetheinyl transferase family protein [Streptomyces albidus (ex Kaewkla and Franco 2022)]|uniref:4'-phosphopantetheinyl transferase family protein n=1 Tax=Streptomyces albidus (ex Kaewkla and Franco 2022) TaxID=722709 RepID=UPI0015EECD1F|nr:4'-phosphopantetheinyl transferase superfamily protein [Streptomyces albidus (ex Kaewkla and Franco 2022)]
MPTTSGPRDAGRYAAVAPHSRSAEDAGLGATVDVRVLRVSAHADEAARDLPFLSEEEKARAAAFRLRADRDRYRVAHTALRRELAARLGGTPSAVTLVRAGCPLCGGPHGRPSLPGDPLHFSLSHAGDLVLLAFASTPVGVDVEEHPELRLATEVAGALHTREQAELAALAEPRRPAAFARCWTRKEAYLKGTGTGLGEDPSVTYVGTAGAPVPPPGWRISDIEVPAGYAAASAHKIDHPDPQDG